MRVCLLAAALLCLAAAGPAGTPMERGGAPRDGVRAGPTVRVRILEKHAPRWIELDGPRRMVLRASATQLVDGGALHDALSLPPGRWRLRGERFERSYDGALHLAAIDGTIAVRLEQPLEAYVAAVVAAESLPGTPPAALRALAIVARSYALAARERHEGGALCDMAHCQVMAGAATAASRAAAEATAGQVLLFGEEVAGATFHAACGGHTADPAATFGGVDRSGAASVADPACDAAPWSATIDLRAAHAAAGELLGVGMAIDRLQYRHGSGGFVVEVIDPATGRRTTGEAFARTLDRGAGWGVVRSPRFSVWVEGDHLRITGRGHGHGVGLCQAGASRLATRGLDSAAILARYFPLARLGRLPAD